MKRMLLLVLAVGLLIGTLSSCGEQSGSAQRTPRASLEEKKRFIFADTTFNPENAEPDINPHNDYAGWACIRYGVGETLFRYSDTMDLEPWLAAGYESINEFTWKITLRDDIIFTSGRPMDGAAVKECLDYLITVHHRAKGDLCIDHIDADGQTVTIVTAKPKPALLNYLSDPYSCIIDVRAGVSSEGIVSGTGPYKAVGLVSGERLDLVKNEDYWNGEPKVDEITVLTVTDGDTMTMALQAGEVDAAYGLPYVSYPIFQNDDYTFSSSATSRAFYLWMNFESPTTKDPAVRKAIAMGIDKEGFVTALLDGNGYPAVGPFPDSFALGGGAVTAETFNPEKAQQILESAGWIDTDGDGIREKDGQRLEIRWLTYPSRQELPLLAEFAQASLKNIGINVSIISTAEHNRLRTDSTTWDVYASAMVTAPTGDPEYFFTTCTLGNSDANNGHYYNDRLEELAAEMSVTFATEARNRLAIEMQQIVLDDNAYVFCSFLRMSIVSKASVTGLAAHPCDYYEITVDLDIT